MPITFSLRPVAWLGLPSDDRYEPHVSAPLVYPDAGWSAAHDLAVAKPTHENRVALRQAKAAGLPTLSADEIQYIVHGSPVVALVSARKGDPDSARFFDRNGSALDAGSEVSIEHCVALFDVRDAFLSAHQAGALR